MRHFLFAHTARAACILLALCLLLTGCGVIVQSSPSTTGNNTGNSASSQTGTGSGVSGVQVFVEPNAGESVITNAIAQAQKSIWLEIYLLSDRSVINALENAAHRGLDVRVMLEPHPYGGGSSPSSTIDKLIAAGVKAQPTAPSFTLTHEKGMIIDGTTAFIMTSNFTRSALGGYSGSNGYANREYGIIDTNQLDVRTIINIFVADWNRSDVQINDPNLVVSPINARNAFLALINSAHSTLLIEAEEMGDDQVEQALVAAGGRGVHVEIILPSARSVSTDTNSAGISTIAHNGVQVREDPHYYMHAKMMIVDGIRAFVGSENISTNSLNDNRELGILVADAGVLNTLQQTFQQDWSDSHSV